MLSIHIPCTQKELVYAETSMSCLGLFVSFIYNCLPKKNQTITESIQYALHLFLMGCVLVIVTQQLTHTLDIYHLSHQEYRDAVKLYAEEGCAHYKGSSRARLQECSELNTIIMTSITTRTLIRVTQSWNSCIYLSCTDLVNAICTQLQYKIALVLVLLAVISYSMKIFRCTKKKSKDYIQRKQYEITHKQLKQQAIDLENVFQNISLHPSYQSIPRGSISSSPLSS